MDRREWLLKRNCSLTPRQTFAAFLILCGAAFAVGVVFMLLHGTWIVLGFAAVEIFAISAAFLHYARHATDHEHIALKDNCLLIEQCSAGAVQRIRLDVGRILVVPPHHARDMIVLEARGMRIEVGRFVTDAVRRQVAQELRRGLLGCSLVY